MNPLKPVMAAILAAFFVMTSPSATVFAEDRGLDVPATHPQKQAPGDESNSVNILAELISKDKKAQADVSARVQSLLLEPDFKGRSYVTPDLPKSPEAKTIPALVTQWVEQHPADAAKLYYVARPQDGKVPEWVTKHPKGATIFRGEDKGLPERLGNYLAGADQQHPAGSQVGTVAVSGMTDSLVKFLDGAATGAGVILDPTVPKTPEELRREIERNDTTAAKPPVGQPGGTPLDGTGTGFEFGDLYEKGAYVTEVYSPKDQGYRRLSVKVYTTTDADGNTQNQVGIVDITPNDPKTPYGPKLFPMNQSDDATFSLIDGGRNYSLSLKMVDGKHNLVIKRPDTKEDSGPGVAAVSMEDLARRRLGQAVERGTIDIGGKPYYVLGQGGSKGSLLFFAKDEVDGRADLKDPRFLGPKAKADVSEVAAGGGTRRISTSPGPDMGKIDGKEYHLEFDEALKMWKVTPGKGAPPAHAPAPAAAGKADGKADGKTSGAPAPAGDIKTLDDVVAYFKREHAGYEETNPDANEGFSDEMKKKVHILVKRDDAKPYCFLLAPDLGADNPAPCFGYYAAGGRLLAVRGAGDYGVLEYEKSNQYNSLDFLSGKSDKASGIYGKGGMTGVEDVAVALDMLETYEKGKFSEADLNLIEKRLQKHSGGDYLISNDKDKKIISIRNVNDKETCRVWPGKVECETGDNAGYENRKGPGTVVDLAFGPDGEFQNTLGFDPTREMSLVKPVSPDGGTALYFLDDQAAGEKRWFVTVRATMENENAVLRSKAAQIFGTGKDWNALPAAYTLKGYATTEVPRTAKMGLILSEEGKKGTLSLYRWVIPAKDGSNVKNKKSNCVGPLVFWGEGVDEAEAVKACRAGKF